MANASPPYSRSALLVILVGVAILVAGLVVLLLLVFVSPEQEHKPDEPVPTAAQPVPPTPAAAAPDAGRPLQASSQTTPARRPLAPATARPPRQSGVVGVAECDDFLAKFAACAANQVKENRRRYLNGLLPVYRDKWIRDAKDPGGRETLVSSCNKAAAHFRITLAEANCDL